MKLSLALALALGLPIVVLAGCQVYQTKGPAASGKTVDLTPVCHGGKQTLRVEGDAEVRAHLGHGDTLGQCPPAETSDAG